MVRDREQTARDEAPKWSNRLEPPPKKTRRLGRLTYLIVLFPLIFVGFGGYMLFDAIRFIGVAQEAVGTVVDIDIHSDSDGTTYTPTFQFTDEGGQIRTGRTHISSSGYDYAMGAQEEILFDPHALDADVRVNGVFSLWGLPVIFSTVGLLVFAGLLFGLRMSRNRANA